ncbi:MAG: SDR family NAD(P)-dependent oxidoreductase [Mariprofundaceae bacterium]|nr:SDR family NAD(P)-dependent oxidoreductase [Mariprofundaceae bacterium]
MSNAGKVLITGATGGFGREFACQLEKRGFDLILHGRDRARMRLTLDALQQPDRHMCMYADLAVEREVNSLIEQVKQQDGLTGLVNNAGFGVWGLFERAGIAPQLDTLRTDLLAPVNLTHALLPILKRNAGFIINVSSLAGETPLPHMSIYAAAKAGVTWWSEALRIELTDKVRVVTLAPGPSPTGFRDVSGMPEGTGSAFRTNAALVVRQSLRTMDHGGGYCVPGIRHKLLFLMQKLTPRRIALPLVERQLRR